MRKNRQISACLFLGIFSLLLLHEFIPHVHAGDGHSHAHAGLHAEADFHHHGPEKSQEEDQNSDVTGIFFLLLSGHSQSFHLDSFDEWKVVRQAGPTSLHSWALAPANKERFAFAVGDLPDKSSFYPPPDYYPSPVLSLEPLRGPPSLG